MSAESFVDEAEITVTAGRGGDGLVAFRREKFEPRGGPNGGDGGRGGSIVFVACRNLATLKDQKVQTHVRARAGEPGGGSGKTGKSGDDVEVRLPVGTLVFDDEDEQGAPLVDLDHDGASFVVARGGRGGLGNQNFATATRQAPDFATPGREGQRRRLRLSLKLLADVGLLGLPNAGKSTLLRRISAARPRVASYPFTTLRPSLGVVEIDEHRFVVADIPGLIEGASEGVGLGDRFLRHVERTRVLVHVLDAGSLAIEPRDLLADHATIRRELAAYDEDLAARPEVVLLNKIDLLADDTLLDEVEAKLREQGLTVLRGSGATGAGLPALLREVRRVLEAEEARAAALEAERRAADEATGRGPGEATGPGVADAT